MVHRDEFTDMRAEFGQLFKTMNDMKVFRERIEQSTTDDHFMLLKTDHKLQEAESQMDQLKIEMKQAIANLKHKLDQDIFDDEIEQIRNMAR